MRLAILVSLGVLSGTACGGPGPAPMRPLVAPAAPGSEDPSGYSAVVHRNWARFSFPRLLQESFAWWTPAQRTQLTTYAWTVLVRGQADTAFSVGYWLPAVGLEPYARWYSERRTVPVGTQYGSLADLLRAGTQDVRRLESHVAVPVPRLAAHVTAHGGRVIIDLRGASTVHRLFALRPSHVAFYAYLPGGPPSVAQVPVVYVDR